MNRMLLEIPTSKVLLVSPQTAIRNTLLDSGENIILVIKQQSIWLMYSTVGWKVKPVSDKLGNLAEVIARQNVESTVCLSLMLVVKWEQKEKLRNEQLIKKKKKTTFAIISPIVCSYFNFCFSLLSFKVIFDNKIKSILYLTTY